MRDGLGRHMSFLKVEAAGTPPRLRRRVPLPDAQRKASPCDSKLAKVPPGHGGRVTARNSAGSRYVDSHLDPSILGQLRPCMAALPLRCKHVHEIQRYVVAPIA